MKRNALRIAMCMPINSKKILGISEEDFKKIQKNMIVKKKEI